MKAILRNGFLALAIVLAQAIPASAQSYSRSECKTELIKAKERMDLKKKGKYVLSKSDRRKAILYYNKAISAYNEKRWKDCHDIAFLIRVQVEVVRGGGKTNW